MGSCVEVVAAVFVIDVIPLASGLSTVTSKVAVRALPARRRHPATAVQELRWAARREGVDPEPAHVHVVEESASVPVS